MARVKSEHVCSECGFKTPRPLGRCPSCDAWGSFEEVVQAVAPAGTRPRAAVAGAAHARPLRLSEINHAGFHRLTLPLEEFSRVLGGGIVQGSVVLVGGDPGVGKSTLLTQVAHLVALTGCETIYISGEESLAQVGLRARRMSLDDERLSFLSETDADGIVEAVRATDARLVVVDSIQSLMARDVEALPGSISQLRECTLRLLNLAKSTGVALFLIGHVTKEGAIAGPKVLEHMVDTVLYLEGERFNSYRLLRSTKNRFGPTNEVGVFEMREEGMVEVPNPSAAFLSDRGEPAPGSVVTVMMEGTRPLLVEVQALVSKSSFSLPRRWANGFDSNRLHLLTAVIARRLGVPIVDQDVYLNVVGGLRIDEPAADLAAALAVISAARDVSLARDLVVVGEVGLSGEVRSVGQLESRLREATKLGFSRALTPRTHGAVLPKIGSGIDVLWVSTLREALRVLGL